MISKWLLKGEVQGPVRGKSEQLRGTIVSLWSKGVKKKSDRSEAGQFLRGPPSSTGAVGRCRSPRRLLRPRWPPAASAAAPGRRRRLRRKGFTFLPSFYQNESESKRTEAQDHCWNASVPQIGPSLLPPSEWLFFFFKSGKIFFRILFSTLWQKIKTREDETLIRIGSRYFGWLLSFINIVFEFQHEASQIKGVSLSHAADWKVCAGVPKKKN